MVNKLKTLAAQNLFWDRWIYIAYRICGVFYSLLFLICRLFPVRENKIVCCNMKGKRYGDNPKYILDEIIRQEMDSEMIWLLKNGVKAELPVEVRRAAYNPFSLAYHLSTAKIWIDSNTKAIGTLKRKGQFYIQTWHGSHGLKKIGCDIKSGHTFIDSKPFIYNAKIIDLMISNSHSSTEMYRTAFRYSGKILECGSPRNDIFFEDPSPYKEKIYHEFSIQNKKIILYAPTFRADLNTDCMKMDFEAVLNSFEQRFGGEWVILIRMHPLNIRDAEQFISYSDKIINATDYNVVQELLAASDAMVTDYSSAMFDFVTTGKPCFLYMTDYEKYKEDRDVYMNIANLPFPLARDMEALIQNVVRFDETIYKNKLQKFFNLVGCCDKGSACEEVVKYIRGIQD